MLRLLLHFCEGYLKCDLVVFGHPKAARIRCGNTFLVYVRPLLLFFIKYGKRGGKRTFPFLLYLCQPCAYIKIERVK